MKSEPLFIRFANRDTPIKDMLDIFLSSVKHDPSKEIIAKAKDDPPNVSDFREDFRNMLSDLIENGVNQYLINYVNSYMKPSLEEIVDSSGGSRAGEKRWVFIKDKDAPWVEAIVCYNLCLYLKVYGINEIKLCPVCRKFFSNKGKYAKFCSEGCKSTKVR